MIDPEAPAPLDEGDVAPRLTLFEQCQIFAALRWRSAPRYYKAKGSREGKLMPGQRWLASTIGAAFGVSPVTISNINTCLTTVREPKRYQILAGEFDKLGEAAFMEKYYTVDLREKLARAKRAMQ